MNQIGDLPMLDINIKVEVLWHIIIEPDYSKKKKPPFPPILKVYIAIPDTKYTIMEPIDSADMGKICYRTGYLAGQSFGFTIPYDPDKNPNTQIARNVRSLNRKFHLNIDEDFRILAIKNLYQYRYFREDNHVDVISKEEITLSQEYINERVLSHVG